MSSTLALQHARTVEGRLILARIPREAPEGTFEHYFFTKLLPQLHKSCGYGALQSLRSIVGRFAFWRGKFSPLSEINEALIVDHEEWASEQGLSIKSVATIGQKIRMLLRMIDEQLCRNKLQPYRAPPVIRCNGIGSKVLTVSEYTNDCYLLTRSLRPGSEYAVRHSCELLENWLARQSIVPDVKTIDELLLSGWVKWLELRFAPRTAKRHRADVIGVLNDAADAGLRNEIRARRVRCPNVPPPVAQGWPVETIQRLILAARQLQGRLGSRVSAALYFEALYRVTWCLALRRADLWALRLSDIRPDGRVWFIQRKTRTMTTGQLGPDEMSMLGALKRDPPLAWPHNHDTFYTWSTRAKQLAGITDPGHLHRIRKSAATDVAKNQGRSAATRILGHVHDSSADRFYIDETLMDEPAVEPTRLRLPLRIGGPT